MTQQPIAVIDQLRRIFEARDLNSLSPLLAEDVRWGDDDNHPRTCRNRNQVLTTFSRLIEDEVTADITEMVQGSKGILCGLDVHWYPGAEETIYQAYMLRDDKIVEIRGYEDRQGAAEAVGL